MEKNRSSLIKYLQLLRMQQLQQEREAQFEEWNSRELHPGVPSIQSIPHLAHLISVDVKFLASVVASPSAFYRSFQIPKKSGGNREILAPYPELQAVQRWIQENVLAVLEVHPAASAYVKGRSIIDHCEPHCGNRDSLITDLIDFFGSIRLPRVISLFRSVGYESRVAYFLARMCCSGEDSLPQGGVTSPTISNLVAKRLDRRLSGFAFSKGAVYTRYADDIVLSADGIDSGFRFAVERIVQSEGFLLHPMKTRLVKAGGRRLICGLHVEDKVSVTKRYRRELRKDLHYVATRGLVEHLRAIGRFDPLYLDRLLGRLNYVRAIQPDVPWVLDGIELIRRILADGRSYESVAWMKERVVDEY